LCLAKAGRGTQVWRMESHVHAEKIGALGLLTLARPQALNALTQGMIDDLHSQLTAWAADQTIKAVAIRGEGRGFCAGGDIRAVRQAVVDGSDAGAAFLHDEYLLNALIGAYPKPYIALMHGIVMGGGAGVSVHGRYRLADPGITFAMPETGIGFIPDVGASHFLSRLPDNIGMYLALSGARIGAGDALAIGLATHGMAQGDFDAVITALARGESVEAAIRPHVKKIVPGPLTEHRRRIATIFSAATVEAVLERLDRDGSGFAQQTAQTIRAMSPTSVKLVFRQMREAAALDLKQCLALEYRLAVRVLAGHDFREGVRAALVDKDRSPRWQPSSLAGVTDIAPFFAPLQNELFSLF
jgi:enoyl-CoA hydratase